MSLEDIARGLDQENGEDDLQSVVLEEYETICFNLVVKDLVKNQDITPPLLFQAANIISDTSSGIRSLKSKKTRKKFQQLLGQASCLVVVIWESYNKSNFPTIWPSPRLKTIIIKLVDTVQLIYALMMRKGEKDAVKRILRGFFGLRDFIKFRECHRVLNSVALGLQNKPHNINVDEVLLEVVNRAQSQHTDTHLPEEATEGDSPIRKYKKQDAVIQEFIAESSRPCRAETLTPAKPGTKKVRYEEVEEDVPQPAAKSKGKVNPSSNSSHGGSQKKPETSSEEEYVEERSAESSKKAGTRVQDLNEDSEGNTFEKGSQAKNPARPKPKRAVTQREDQKNKAEVPVGNAKGPPKKRHGGAPAKRSQTVPVTPQPSQSISGFTFDNNGEGTITNQNIGNIYNSTITDVGNNYSQNHYRYAEKHAA